MPGLASASDPDVQAVGAVSPAVQETLPREIVLGVVALSLAPALITVLGFDLGDSRSAAAAPGELHPAAGPMIHALLEWSAVVVAVLTAVLAVMHYRITGSAVTPIIGLSLFWAGCMDAFHILAAARLVEATAANQNLIPFTWALCRAFHAAVLVAGAGLLLTRRSLEHVQSGGLIKSGSAFGVVACAAILYAATSPELPRTYFSDSVVSRPWDVVALVLFLLLGGLVLPSLQRRFPSRFCVALWLATLPNALAQAHMAFGSTTLFDHHFVMGHFLKVVAYVVPFVGLVMDWSATYRYKERLSANLATEVALQTEKLRRQAAALERSNRDLEQFAYVASHDLKSPLRAIDNLAEWIAEDLGDGLIGESREHFGLIRRRVGRMEALLTDLLEYSRVGRKAGVRSAVDVEELLGELDEWMADATRPLELQVTTPLPVVDTERAALELIFRNLVNNAIKHHDGETVRVSISAEEQGDRYVFRVEDDGPGIPESFHDEVFGMFRTLRSRDQVEGSGMGLALVKKVVEQHEGKVRIESPVTSRGTAFIFTWPRHPDTEEA